MDSGFILLMVLTLAFGIFGTWRSLEQEKRESEEKKQ